MRAARVRKRRRGWNSLAGLLRLCLIVSMWNGPLPWVDAHGSLAHCQEVNPHLARHLSQFHPTADLFQSEMFDWHMHFFFPGSAPTEESIPEQPQPAAPAPTTGVRIGDLSNAWSTALSMPVKVLAVLDTHSPLPRYAPGPLRGRSTQNYLQSLLQERTAHQLLGIALC